MSSRSSLPLGKDHCDERRASKHELGLIDVFISFPLFLTLFLNSLRRSRPFLGSGLKYGEVC